MDGSSTFMKSKVETDQGSGSTHSSQLSKAGIGQDFGSRDSLVKCLELISKHQVAVLYSFDWRQSEIAASCCGQSMG